MSTTDGVLDMTPKTFQTRNLSPEHFRVIGDRYLCEIIEFDQFIDMGGPMLIMLAEQPAHTQGWRPARVVRKGNGHRLERDVELPLFAEVGDMVIIEQFSGRYLDIGGKKYVLVNQTALLMIVDPADMVMA